MCVSILITETSLHFIYFRKLYSLYPSHTPIEQTLFIVIMGVKTIKKYDMKAFTLNNEYPKKNAKNAQINM